MAKSNTIQLMKAVAKYGKLFGHPVPLLAMQHLSTDECLRQIRAAIASGKPVPGWDRIPMSDVVDDRPEPVPQDADEDADSMKISDEELHNWLIVRATKAATRDHERLKREAELIRAMQTLTQDESTPRKKPGK